MPAAHISAQLPKAPCPELVADDGTGRSGSKGFPQLRAFSPAAGEPYGIATIWDFDIMLWLFGQVRYQIDRGQEPSRYIGFHGYERLTGAKRHSGQVHYKQLEAAITRLKNTSIMTNVGNDQPTEAGGGWIDNFILHRHPSGRLDYVEVWIDEWIFKKVIDQARY